MKYGAAVDCYALGCVVYQMLHGSTPYFHQDEDTQLDNIIEGGLAYPKNSFGQVRETGGEREGEEAARTPAQHIPWTLVPNPPCPPSRHVAERRWGASQVSSNCMDFMQKLLEPDQLHRMTIEEAMRHKWLQGYM